MALATTIDVIEPWCSLGHGNNPFKKPFSSVVIPTFSEEDFQAHLTVFRNTERTDGLEPTELACALYYFMNRSVIQGRVVKPDEVGVVLTSLQGSLVHHPTLDKSLFVTRILLDLYEQDVHIVRRTAFQELLTSLLDQAHLREVPIERCCRPVVGGIGLLVTLVSAVLMYGLDDAEVAAFPWPIDVARSDATCSLEFLLDRQVFCDGLVHLILFAAAVFEKSFDETDIFHWDLALIVMITKNQVLKHETLEHCFTTKVINQLYRSSCSYMYESVAAGFTAVEAITGGGLGGEDAIAKLGGRIQWKRHVIALIGLLLTGSPAELQGVCILPDSAARFPDILKTLMSKFGTLQGARTACQDHMQNVRASWSSWTSWIGGGGSHREAATSVPPLRPQPSPLLPPESMTGRTPVTKASGRPGEAVATTTGVTDAEREQFWKDILEEEARNEAARVPPSSSKKSKSKKKKPDARRESMGVPKTPAPPPTGAAVDANDDDDDDEASLERLSKMKSNSFRLQPTVLPTLIQTTDDVDDLRSKAPTMLKRGVVLSPALSSPKKTITVAPKKTPSVKVVPTPAPTEPVPTLAKVVPTPAPTEPVPTLAKVVPTPAPTEPAPTSTEPVPTPAPTEPAPTSTEPVQVSDESTLSSTPTEPVVPEEKQFGLLDIGSLRPFRAYNSDDFAAVEGRVDLTDSDVLKKWVPVVYRDALFRDFARIVSIL
jgi:hypothetical protein